MIFHFAYFRGKTNWPWLDFHTLCLQSCKRFTSAERIIVHYDRDGSGPHWDAAKALPYVEWRQVVPEWSINGYPITDQRIAADYYRLSVLASEGGFFCDLDFVFLGSFEQLRHAESGAIIGTQCPQKHKLACGLIGAVPEHPFILAYLDQYETWSADEQKKPWTFANNIPYQLSEIYPIDVLKRQMFYPLAWSNTTFWEGKPLRLTGAVAIHLWESIKPQLSVPTLMKTCLAPVIRSIQAPSVTQLTMKAGICDLS